MSERPLAGRVVLVTGASSGLGTRFARHLADLGASVALTGRRLDRLEAVAAEIRAAGGTAATAVMDVTDIATIAPAFDKAEAELGPLWAVINNSGVGMNSKVEEVDEALYDSLFDTNVRGAFFVATEAGRRMIRRGQGGRVVNIASMLGVKTMVRLSLYSMTKAAIMQMTKSMALEWARYDINVNALLPGYILTDINAELFNGPNGEAFMRKFPRRRVGVPEDLDGALALLVDPAARFITGTNLLADDAQSLGG
ncbi:SDR family NAD(P)-dependent oxidoreductase [Zavarzinia sp. CC-PAN008]|uniref:SDR family NAD(P)-dependent oxidoreductase n=1 Tax=Zavarzinia sp. CC-PAN008 TaxID=3243332 RepID=UPI003F744781